MRLLLDVNVWVALFDDAHIRNADALALFRDTSLKIATCALTENGVLREDLLEMLALNVRHPRDFRGDLAAQIGSAKLGEQRLDAVIAEFGAPVLQDNGSTYASGTATHSRGQRSAPTVPFNPGSRLLVS